MRPKGDVNGWVQSLRLAAPSLLWVAILFVVYSDKAYTIDDPFFLAQAQQVLREPLNPSGFDIAWGRSFGRASEVSPTGPGMAYILAPTAALGGAEWAAHLTVFAFLAAGAWLAVAIARRLGATPGEARLVSLVLVSTPTVMAMAGTAMPDVPAMTVGLVGLERIVAFRASRRTSQGLLAAAAFAAAILIRSHAVMLLPVAAMLLVGAELRSGLRAIDARRLWPLGTAVLVAAAVAWITRDARSGTLSFATSVNFLNVRAIPRHLVGFCLHFVIAIPFALAWSAMHLRRLSPWLFLAAVVVAPSVVEPHSAWIAPLAAVGAVVLVDAAREAWRSRDPDRMALILWLFAALPVSVYVHLPVKYLTISAPAVALLVVLASRARSTRLRRGVLAAWMVGGSVLGLCILEADARLAAVGREAAARLVAPQTAAGKTVWHAGSWGFHWYAEAAGARPLAADPDGPRPGDCIAYSSRRPAALGEERDGRVVASVVDGRPGGRIMDLGAGAGFYSPGGVYGYLPWSWGSGEVDHYALWCVTRPPHRGRRRRSRLEAPGAAARTRRGLWPRAPRAPGP